MTDASQHPRYQLAFGSIAFLIAPCLQPRQTLLPTVGPTRKRVYVRGKVSSIVILSGDFNAPVVTPICDGFVFCLTEAKQTKSDE